VTIDVLPDNVYLDIFDFYIQELRNGNPSERIEVWITLVHVCQRWRSVIFGSPRRLDLQLLCTDKTSVTEMLDIWPPLPIFIWAYGSTSDTDNILALLNHKDRICQISLRQVPNLLLEEISAALMQESFPLLTNLELERHPTLDPIFMGFPSPFLCGSSPLLQHVMLDGIPFPDPELPNFLSSSVNHLTSLSLYHIPLSGYISPNAMVTCISALISLEELHLEFEWPHSLPDWESRLPRQPTRSVQPALRIFRFKGVSEYLEDFVARIDAPQLHDLSMCCFDNDIFDTSQLVLFINRITSLKPLDVADVDFTGKVWFNFSTETRGPGGFSVEINCGRWEWEFSTMVQFCTSFSRCFSSVETLRIINEPPYYQGRDNFENATQEWLDFLLLFTAVRDIHLCETSAGQISFMLQELAEGRLTEVLPRLQTIFLNDVFSHFQGLLPSRRIHTGIVRLVAARELSDHPITISHSSTV
jgi:hypothetical protein